MKRDYLQLLFECLELFPCVAIIGPRQCGKTTLLKDLPGNWKIFDLEDSADLLNVSRDPGLFLRLHGECIAFDECQLLPDLFPALRVAIDRERTRPGRFVITGSSSPKLLKSISESLAGRVAIIELAPFTYRETAALTGVSLYRLLADQADTKTIFNTLHCRDDLQAVHQYWLRGGYPEPWLKKYPRFHQLWMKNYQETYLERDVRKLFPNISSERYRLFLHFLGNVSGQIINRSSMAGQLGVSSPTIRDYLEIAHGTFIWRNVPSYSKKAVKRLVKHSKGYLRDTGLLHSLLHIKSLDQLHAHPIMGLSWESMVIEEFLRNLNTLGVSFEYFYYRTSGGAEVDLVIEGDFGLIPIEIKYTQSVAARELRGISDFIHEQSCLFGIVVNNDDRIRYYDEKLLGIPFSAL